MGKEIRSSSSPTLLPPSAFAVAHAWPVYLPSPLSHLYKAHTHLGMPSASWPAPNLEPTWAWRQGGARSPVPEAGHSFSLGTSLRSAPRVCQPVSWHGWQRDKGCCSRAEVAQLGER